MSSYKLKTKLALIRRACYRVFLSSFKNVDGTIVRQSKKFIHFFNHIT